MANATAPYVVTGPARTPAPYGLFSVVDFREDGTRRWENGGVTWASFDGTELLGVVGAVQADDTLPGTPKTFESSTDQEEAGVFTVYGQQKVTPIAWSQEDASTRARAILTSLEERTVETVLAGTIAGLAQTLSDAPVIGSDSDMLEVVAILEDWLADHYGSRGVLHMNRGNALRGIAAKALETRGRGLYTRLGTPVVAGQGYPDDAAYATSALLGYRSDVFENTGRPYDLLDKGTNDLYAIAERTYSLGFESAALGAVTIGDSA